jgi:hypothetical protein
MQIACAWTIHRMPWLVFGSLIGCADWPRYKHKATINHEALSPNQSPKDGVNLKWVNIPSIEEPIDSPTEPLQMAVGDGFSTEGVLSGLGWSTDQTPDRQSACGETRAVPPASPGNYTGDIDWFTVTIQQPATLCMQLRTDIDTARLDAALYVLDDCNEPVSVFVHPDTEIPIGTDVPSDHVQWAVSLSGGLSVGIGLAGFFPDDDELEASWSMDLALVPSVAGAGGTLCPEER